ncbi:sensor histidine kinase [Actinoplanes sp. NPDC024001]|uniref:sensor histidine kinase n=1 Tax=Actinoplanes sp. NPDC024001 TaxID=3154598 RepID=UPI0033E5172D
MNRQRALSRAYAVTWVVLGLCPPLVAVADRSAGLRTWSLIIAVVLAAGYAAARRFPALFLGLLIAGLGASAFLLGGGAAFLIVSIPQFWLFSRDTRQAITLSGLAAAVTLAGGALRTGLYTGNSLAVVIGFAVGTLGALLIQRLVRDHAVDTARLRAELDLALQRQGAAEERNRMAREIHDTLAQGFASIVVLAEAARAGLPSDPDRTARQLRSIEQTARENLAEARILVGSAPQATGTIREALRRVLDRFAEDTGVAVEADLADIAGDQQTRIALLRCLQESLANVRKHAAATTVGVVLAANGDTAELEITDDGRGFVVAGSRGFGLDGMRRRLAELGGELVVTSSPGDGTRILATLPASGATR